MANLATGWGTTDLLRHVKTVVGNKLGECVVYVGWSIAVLVVVGVRIKESLEVKWALIAVFALSRALV